MLGQINEFIYFLASNWELTAVIFQGILVLLLLTVSIYECIMAGLCLEDRR